MMQRLAHPARRRFLLLPSGAMSGNGLVSMTPVERQAEAVVTSAAGRMLVIGHIDAIADPLMRVDGADHWPDANGIYASVVSVAGLANTTDLGDTLEKLRPHLAAASVIYFCEPTATSDAPTVSPPHDITTSLWRHGYTVVACGRITVGRWPRRQEYCWGRARATPDTAPPRRWT
jgi:hypothetical protein